MPYRAELAIKIRLRSRLALLLVGEFRARYGHSPTAQEFSTFCGDLVERQAADLSVESASLGKFEKQKMDKRILKGFANASA